MIVEHGSLYWYCQGLLDEYKKLRDRNRYVFLSGSMSMNEYYKYNDFYNAQIRLMNQLMMQAQGLPYKFEYTTNKVR